MAPVATKVNTRTRTAEMRLELFLCFFSLAFASASLEHGFSGEFVSRSGMTPQFNSPFGVAPFGVAASGAEASGKYDVAGHEEFVDNLGSFLAPVHSRKRLAEWFGRLLNELGFCFDFFR